MNSCSCPM